MDKLKEVLETLNGPQRRVVEHLPDSPLQILAGPGSGKTKALTSRIAYLILVHLIPPWAICAVTFTNKAANEMRERLTKLIGKRSMRQLKMGTFHALCASLLRMHGQLVGLAENFTICDAHESEKLVGKLLKPYKDAMMAENNLTYPRNYVYSKISRAKGKGLSPEGYRKEWLDRWNMLAPHASLKTDKLPFEAQLVFDVFRDYERELRKSNCLDFDDLIIFGVKLVRDNKKVVRWCRHVLVDEFQDTNTLQYQLMRYIASDHDHITIVGDPDQSIYGWRSADITNLQNMQRDFPRTQQIFLEQNYRSTSSILNISLAIISQDEHRVKKSLYTDNPAGPTPMLCWCSSEHAESLFIAAEIKRLVAASGGMLKWQDFAILVRKNAMSRPIEAALQIESIPNRVLKGHKFFERAEIKDILAYLQIVDNPQFLPAFLRTVNMPPRGLGEKSVAQIVARAEKENISALEVVERICHGTLSDSKPSIKKRVAPYVKIVHKLRKLADERMGPADLVREVVKLTEYEAYLRKGDKDVDARMENVDELISFATLQQDGMEVVAWERKRAQDSSGPSSANAPLSTSSTKPAETEVIDISDSENEHDHALTPKSDKVKGKQKAVETSKENTHRDGTGSKPKITPLREFLEASMLCTDASSDTEESKDKVTISTCHAAKGLEWPVVFVPAVVSGMFTSGPSESGLSQDADEGRRLLYVATTRAQGLLYITHSSERMMAGETKKCKLSEFVMIPLRNNLRLMSPYLPQLDNANLCVLSQVLGRPEPDAAQCERATAAFNDSPLQSRLRDLVDRNFPWPDKDQPTPAELGFGEPVRSFDNNVLHNGLVFVGLGRPPPGPSSVGSVGGDYMAPGRQPVTAMHRSAQAHPSRLVSQGPQQVPSRPLLHNGLSFPGLGNSLAGPSSISPVGIGGDYMASGRRPVTAAYSSAGFSLQAGPSSSISQRPSQIASSRPRHSENGTLHVRSTVQETKQTSLPFKPTSNSTRTRRSPSPSPDIAMTSTSSARSQTPRKTDADFIKGTHSPRRRSPSPVSQHANRRVSGPASSTALRALPKPNPKVARPSLPSEVAWESTEPTATSSIGVKRRLGMGRPMTGYSNKKFKTPGQG